MGKTWENCMATEEAFPFVLFYLLGGKWRAVQTDRPPRNIRPRPGVASGYLRYSLFCTFIDSFFFSYIENVCSKKVIRISQKRSIYYNQKHLFYATWRRRISIIVCLDAALMFYLYYRHNRYCEPYMYRYQILLSFLSFSSNIFKAMPIHNHSKNFIVSVCFACQNTSWLF